MFVEIFYGKNRVVRVVRLRTGKNYLKRPNPLLCPVALQCDNVIKTDQSNDDQLNFHDGGRYHIETSQLICRANQWTGFYMILASVVKELT